MAYRRTGTEAGEDHISLEFERIPGGVFMGRASTKANKNIYQQCREKQRLTRAQASELMSFLSESQIERIEYGKIQPHPEDVLAMADAYKNAGLCNYYPSRLWVYFSLCICLLIAGRLMQKSFARRSCVFRAFSALTFSSAFNSSSSSPF